MTGRNLFPHSQGSWAGQHEAAVTASRFSHGSSAACQAKIITLPSQHHAFLLRNRPLRLLTVTGMLYLQLQRYEEIDIMSIQPVGMSGLLFTKQAIQELLGSTVAFLQLMILAELLEGFLILC